MTTATPTRHPIYAATAAQPPTYDGGPRYVSLADTARLIRATLAREFPGVRFSVRSHSYTGGASIDVRYPGVAGYAPLATCYCATGPDVDPSDPNYCRTCGYRGSLEPIYNAGMPTPGAVRAAVAPFAGADFDGMIDMQYPVRSWLLPDGAATFGDSPGTVASRGSDPGYAYPAPDPDAIRVHFGTAFVFVEARA